MPNYSHSRLKTFRDCPRQYAFRYVERVKVPRRRTPDTYLGSSLHLVLKTLYEHGARGVLVPLDDALAAYDAEWNKINPATMTVTSQYETVDDYIRQGRELLMRHYERYQPFGQGTLLSAEKTFTFEMPGSPFRFMARIDKLWKRDDGVVEVCDYKTSKALARPQDPIFQIQMGIYQMAVQAAYPDWDNIEVAQFFLRHDESVAYRMTPDELDMLADQLRNEVYAILDAIRLVEFPAVEGHFCNYCDFHNYCPAKRHAKQLEEAADKTDAELLRKLADRFLEKNEALKELKAEVEALKIELKAAARETGMSKFEGGLGEVFVKLAQKEKFITKTKDPAGFAKLGALIREFELDEYLMPDTTALMKDIYAKHRLSDEQHAQLGEFVRTEESGRVTGKVKGEDSE